LILKNLYPSNNPLEFRAQLDTSTLNLNIAFHDPITGCQTDFFDLKAKSSTQAFRWLHLGLNAAFENWPSEFIAGSAVRGHAGGDEAHQGIMRIGEETILTEGIWSPWFTGRAAPYVTRTYPIELLATKHPLPQPKSSLEACLSQSLSAENLTESEVQTHLLIAEYICGVDESWAAGYLLEEVFSGSSDTLSNLEELRSMALTLISPPDS
jgi:hypothetical protein